MSDPGQGGIMMEGKTEAPLIRLALPKGRMQKGVFTLLSDAGIRVSEQARVYRPTVSMPGFDTKILKPQNIVEMLHFCSRDIGFAGADWVAELKADVVELLDTGLDPVRLVAAAPEALLVDGGLPQRPLVVASEYETLTRAWIDRSGLDATFVHSYGATEVFPPEDADCIVDNTATGSTLRGNGLAVVDELMTSTTRLYANSRAMDDLARKESIGNFVMLLNSVLEARHRVMLEINVSVDKLESLVEILPCMREPTISKLHNDVGFAVKVAVPRSELARLIPAIKACGGTDLVVTALAQLVP